MAGPISSTCRVCCFACTCFQRACRRKSNALLGLFGLAGSQGVIPPARGQGQGRLVVGMVLVPTHHTAEGLLIRPIGAGNKVAAGTLLRAVSRIDRVRGHSPFGRRPRQLVWEMAQLGGIQVGVHGACMKAHGGHREVLVHDTSIWMRREHLVDGSIDLLTHVPTKPLPRCAARRRELCLRDSLLLKAGAQFGFVAALVPISAVCAGQSAMERPVALTRRGRHEIHNADIHPHHRGSSLRPQRELLIEGEGQPPGSLALGERGGGVERFARRRTFLWYEASLTGTRSGWPLSRVEILSQQ